MNIAWKARGLDVASTFLASRRVVVNLRSGDEFQGVDGFEFLHGVADLSGLAADERAD